MKFGELLPNIEFESSTLYIWVKLKGTVKNERGYRLKPENLRS